MRELARPDQFLTTCMALSRAGVRRRRPQPRRSTSRRSTPTTRCRTRSRCRPAARSAARQRALEAGDLGPWAIYLQADITRGARDQAPFLVTETNAISIGESHTNFPAYDGQWRQAAWALVARGARMVEYWHWHSIHFGNEDVLARRAQPRRRARPLLRRGRSGSPASSSAPGAAVVDLVPDADVGDPVLDARASGRWPSSPRSPPRRTSRPTASSYDRIVDALLRGAVRRRPAGGRRVRPATSATTPRRSPRAGRCSWSPASTSPTTRCSSCLDAYARAGGHLVVGFRTRLRRRGGPSAPRGHARAPARGGRRDLQRVHEPHGARCRCSRGGRHRAARGGDRGHRVGRRARARGRRDRCSATSTRTSAAGPP